jgi:UrcA family protein
MTLQISSCCRLLISLAILLSAAVCLPVSAGDQPVNQGPSTTVKFRDLDLNTDAGRRELLDRLSKAARRVCGKDAFLHSDLGYPQVYGSCYSRSLAAAVDKVHHAQLSAFFADLSRTNAH